MKKSKTNICAALASLLTAIMLFSACGSKNPEEITTTIDHIKGSITNTDESKEPPIPSEGETTLAEFLRQNPELLQNITELKSAEIYCTTANKGHSRNGGFDFDSSDEYTYIYAQNKDGQSEFVEKHAEEGNVMTIFYPVYGMYNSFDGEGILYDTDSGNCEIIYTSQLGSRKNIEDLLSNFSIFCSSKEALQKQGAELIKCSYITENDSTTVSISVADHDTLIKTFGLPASVVLKTKKSLLRCTAVFDANRNLCSFYERLELETKTGSDSTYECKIALNKHNNTALTIPECIRTWISDIENITEFPDYDSDPDDILYVRTLSTDTRVEYDIYNASKKLIAKEYRTFTKHGDLLVTERLDLNGTSLFKEVHTHNYEYDKSGNVIKHTHIFEGEEVERSECTYNDFGSIIKEIVYCDGKIYSCSEYNENGSPIKSVSYDENGNERHRYEFVYDPNGFPVKQTLFEKGKETFSDLYEYHENGELKKQSSYESGSLIRSQEYNEYGDLIKNLSINVLGEVLTVYEYDENGRRIRITEYIDNVIVSAEEFDTNGKFIKYSGYENGKLSYIEEYNEFGNIIRCSYYKNGKLNYVEEYDENGEIIKRI